MSAEPPVRVIVETAPERKGWRWRQVARNGATGAISPKNYDTKALAKRAGERQVEVLNAAQEALMDIVADRMLPEEVASLTLPFAILVMS